MKYLQNLKNKAAAILAFTVMSICFYANGQTTFHKVYKHFDGCAMHAAGQTGDQGFILGGITGWGDSMNAHIVKIDSVGGVQWSKSFHSQSSDELLCVLQSREGGYLLGGTRWDNNSATADLFLIKTNDTGEIQWSKTFGGSLVQATARALMQTHDNGYLIAGHASGGGIINSAVYLLRLDSLGNIKWTRTYNTSGDWPSFILEGDSGGFIVGGYSLYNSSNMGFLMSIDSSGSVLSVKSFGQNTVFNHARLAKDGGYLLGGNIGSSSNPDLYVIKTDSLFNTLWSKRYDHSTYDAFVDIRETSNGLLIAGLTGLPGKSDEILLIKTDVEGNMWWTKTVGRGGFDNVRAIQSVSDTGFILLGTTSDTLNSMSGFYLIKADSAGNSCFTSNATVTEASVPTVTGSFGFTISSLDSSENTPFSSGNYVMDSTLCINYPNVVGLLQRKETIVVYPNPSTGEIHISSPTNISSVAIYDASGRLVYEDSFPASKKTIDLKNVARGFYYYKVYRDEQVLSGKLILE